MASISAGNDEFVGNLIAETVEKIGPDGVISIETSSTSETSVIVEEGMKVSVSNFTGYFKTFTMAISHLVEFLPFMGKIFFCTV